MDAVEFNIQFAGWVAAIRCPFDLSIAIKGFFNLALTKQPRCDLTFEIFDTGAGDYEILIDGTERRPTRDFCEALDIIQTRFVAAVPQPGGGFKIHGGAVGLGGKSVLVLGPDQAAVAATIASLLEQGFRYHSQTCVVLGPEGDLEGFHGPIQITSERLRWLSSLEAFRGQLSAKNSGHAFVTPRREWKPKHEKARCCAVIVAGLTGQKGLQVSTATREMLAHALGVSGHGEIDAICTVLDKLPGLSVAFDKPSALADVPANLLRILFDGTLDKEAFERLLAGISGARERIAGEMPTRSQRSIEARLTIGMACHDDFDGVYFSVQSLRLHHPEMLDRIEFLLIDNNPAGRGAKALKGIEDYVPNYRYVPYAEHASTAVRDRIFHEAAGRYVLSMDCHVMFPAGAIKSLLDYFERNPDTPDLVQGPMMKNALDGMYTHWEPVWRKCMFGAWAYDPAAEDPSAEPFDIPLQGLGVFACRREAWPGFNPAFRGFGGEEGYIHEKFRRKGARTLCLPSLRWLHRFERPFGVPYPLNLEDRIRNYYIGWSELGLPLEPMIEHMTAEMGAEKVDAVLSRLRREIG